MTQTPHARPQSTIAGAILAGGRARRFAGRDKARLIIDGRSIIDRQVELLQSVSDEVFLVGHDPERFHDLGLEVFADRIQGAGALGGILTALESTKAERVVVLACDMPFLVPGVLRALTALASSDDGAWVRTARGPEPLVACYRQSALPHIREAIASGQLRAAELDQRLTLHELTESSVASFGPVEHLLANLNTPEDYGRVQ